MCLIVSSMGETAVRFDIVPQRSVKWKGTKVDWYLGIGKTLSDCCCSIMTDENILPPTVIFK